MLTEVFFHFIFLDSEESTNGTEESYEFRYDHLPIHTGMFLGWQNKTGL